MKNVKRPRYREYQFKILEILTTKADQGILMRPCLQKEFRIPKSSMSNVLSEMESQGLIRRSEWFGNQEKIEITDQGRNEYSSLKTERLKFPIPYSVQLYLDKKEPKISRLFPIQQSFADRGLLHVRNNCCVFGYPGSGKTLIAEMAMANELENNGKVLYCTPYKALDWQKYGDFSQGFGNVFKTKVIITDGDNPIKPTDLLEARIVIATYERVLGAIRAAEPWINDVTLVCADEITLLDDESRGGTIDLVLTHLQSGSKPPRLITLSSLVGNPLQISEWAKAETVVENRPLSTIHIDEWLVYKHNDEIAYLGRDGKNLTKKDEKNVVEHVIEQNLSRKETTLIFVGSRYEAENLAKSLKHYHNRDQNLVEQSDSYYDKEIWEKTELTKELFDLIGYGIAFHHAGVLRKARRYVEDLMKHNLLKTIVATTTLSHGIDYSIDNVIIDLSAISKIHELHGYEYINLKGRTGRYGKSKSASVYILTEKKKIEQAFVKYFQGLPEPILPVSTLTEDALGTTILIEAERHPVSPESVATFLSGTLCARGTKVNQSAVKKTVLKLEDHGYLKKVRNDYTITELGKKINAVNLSPSDAEFALSLSPEMSDSDLLDAASSIDLAKKVRENRSNLSFIDPAIDILMDWIEELPIDTIKEKNISFYHDHDIVELAEYTSTSLRKIADLVSNEKFKQHLNNLQKRVKYGIKTNLAKSALMELPLLSRDKKRQLARSIFDSGIKSILSLAKNEPKKLAKKLKINEEFANAIILDAKNTIKIT